MIYTPGKQAHLHIDGVKEVKFGSSDRGMDGENNVGHFVAV